METTESAATEDKSKGTENRAENQTSSSIQSNVFAQQYTAEEGGVPTNLYCPDCGEEIEGTFLTIFRCPHCDILIFRDDKGNVTNYEQKHTCPECGHTFGDMTDEAPTEFRRMVRNFEQKTEGVMLGFDKIISRILA